MDDEDIRYRVFDRLEAANKHHDLACVHIDYGKADSSAVFEVRGATSPYDARDAVMKGDANRFALIAKFPREFKLNLEGLKL